MITNIFGDTEKTIYKIYKYTRSAYNMSMDVHSVESPLERIRKVLKDRQGTILTSDLTELNIPRTYLLIMERNGEIERVRRGLYRLADAIEDEMLGFQSRFKASVYSHETALYLHDLTDRTPLLFSVSVPIGYHSTSLNASGHKIFYVNRRLFDLGIISIKSPHGNEIKTTDLERTITDILRSRNQVDIQLINDAMKRYVGRKERNIDLLYSYASQFRIQKIIRDYIEILL